MNDPLRGGKAGFSLVELMITAVVAAIVFAAMVPLFANALKTSSTDSRRVIATNIAQARIERVRMLANTTYYKDIKTTNLNTGTGTGTYGSGQFATSFTPVQGGAPYTISTTVTPTDDPTAAYKTVTVTVSRANDGFQTKASTIITNPAAVTTTWMSGSSGDSTGPFSLIVTFKDSSRVTTGGVVVVRYAMNTSAKPTPTPTATLTISPTMTPSAAPTNSTITWSNLTGGSGYRYMVICHSLSGTFSTQPNKINADGSVYFDTNPGVK
jgi:prepilin-type N-terminal cleavage/methylation domain-containing protein